MAKQNRIYLLLCLTAFVGCKPKQKVAEKSVTSANSIISVNDKQEQVTQNDLNPNLSIPDDELIFTSVEVLPSFDGDYSSFLRNNLRYPSAARESKIQGRVLISFVVEKDGSLSSIKVLKGIGAGCDEEVIRVFKISPKWLPGLQNGRKVRVSYIAPIHFQLP